MGTSTNTVILSYHNKEFRNTGPAKEHQDAIAADISTKVCGTVLVFARPMFKGTVVDARKKRRDVVTYEKVCQADAHSSSKKVSLSPHQENFSGAMEERGKRKLRPSAIGAIFPRTSERNAWMVRQAHHA
jgi:hypothetical protein